MLKKIDPLDFVKKNKSMFFFEEGNLFKELAAKVAADAVLLGCKDIHLHNENGWWIIAAEKNWMVIDDFPLTATFNKLIPFPAAGPNSSRSEILMNAFSSNVICCVNDELFPIKGNADEYINNYFKKFKMFHFLVAFN